MATLYPDGKGGYTPINPAIANAKANALNNSMGTGSLFNYSALNQRSPYSVMRRSGVAPSGFMGVNQRPSSIASSGQPINYRNMNQAENLFQGVPKQTRTGAVDTPPNWRKNLLNYIVSPKGQGMAQGLLEASGYSKTPVSFGQAMALGMQRGNQAEATAAASQLAKNQFAFQKEQFAETKAQNAVANFLTNKKIDVDLQNALKPQLSSFTKSLMAAGIDPASPQGLELLEKELAKATSTITLDQKSETEYQKERGTYTAKKLNKIEDDAGMALDNIQNYDAIETLLPMFETGAFSESIMGINKIGQRFGMDLNFGGDTGAAEAIRGLTGKLVMNTLADFKGAISDSERKFAKDINIGLGMSKDGIRMLIAINRKIYQRQITKADIALTWEEKNGSLLKKNEKGQSFNTFWKEYMNDNPIFDDDFKEQLQQQAGKVDAEFEDQVQVIDGKRYIDLDGTIYELKGTE